VDGNGEKKTIWKHLLRWGLIVLGLALGVGGVWSFYVESNRNYGQLATSLITISGVVLTLWMAHERAIEQQEKEDERHNARLESEAKMQDERLKEEARKDRAQRSITQRLDLAKKLATAIEHLSSEENKLKQAAGVQEILFQIDDWYALINSEIDGILGDSERGKEKREELNKESLRRRQELFNIAYNFNTNNVELLKSRARNLAQKLNGAHPHSLDEVKFSKMVICTSDLMDRESCQIDLRFICFREAKLDGALLEGVLLHEADLWHADLRGAFLKEAELCYAKLDNAKLINADLRNANLRGAILEKADLTNADLRNADLSLSYLWGVTLERAKLNGIRLDAATFTLKDSISKKNSPDTILCEANLRGADLRGVDLSGVLQQDLSLSALSGQKSFIALEGAKYNSKTRFPDDFNPDEHGMRLVDETEDES